MKIESPVKRWPGTITLPEYLTIPQAMKWEECLAEARSILPEVEFEFTEDGELDITKIKAEHLEYFSIHDSLKYQNKMLPGILVCVSEWNLEGFDSINFPATPRKSRVALFNWIMAEITKLYKEADEVPNG